MLDYKIVLLFQDITYDILYVRLASLLPVTNISNRVEMFKDLLNLFHSGLRKANRADKENIDITLQI